MSLKYLGKSRVFFGYQTQIYFWTLVCQYKLCSLLPVGDSPNPKSKQEVRWVGSRQLPTACVELSLCCNLMVTLWLLSIVWFIITKRTWSCRKKAAVATGCPTLGGWEESRQMGASLFTLYQHTGHLNLSGKSPCEDPGDLKNSVSEITEVNNEPLWTQSSQMAWEKLEVFCEWNDSLCNDQ